MSINPLHKEIAKLRAELDVANATIADMRNADAFEIAQFVGVARLTPGEACIVALIVKHGRVSYERVYSALYSHRDEPRAYETAKQTMWQARQKLKPYGIIIKTIWGIGWEIGEDSRNALRHLASLPVIESPSLCPLEQAA
jgi:DNA-binding response OmpR family regulator